MVSWQELPSSVREKLKRRLTPEQLRDYIEHREQAMDRHVEKIIEDIEQNERAAEIAFELNQEHVKEELREKGFDQVADVPPKLQEKLPKLRQAFCEGHFQIHADPQGHDRFTLSLTLQLPEGNIQESLPVKPTLQQALLARGLQKHP